MAPRWRHSPRPPPSPPPAALGRRTRIPPAAPCTRRHTYAHTQTVITISSSPSPPHHPTPDAIREAFRFFSARGASALALPEWLPTPGNLRFAAAVARLDAAVLGLIAQRRRCGVARGVCVVWRLVCVHVCGWCACTWGVLAGLRCEHVWRWRHQERHYTRLVLVWCASWGGGAAAAHAMSGGWAGRAVAVRWASQERAPCRNVRLARCRLGACRELAAAPRPPGDLLDSLLLAADEAGQGMGDRAARDEAMTLLVAGGVPGAGGWQAGWGQA